MLNFIGRIVCLGIAFVSSQVVFSAEQSPFPLKTVNKDLLGASAGQFIMADSGTLHFLQVFFYSDAGCTTLLNDGVASFTNDSAGFPLVNGQTYSFNSNSIYQLADNRGITPADVQCISAYMNGGTESSGGASCMAPLPVTCNAGSCNQNGGSVISVNWSASGTTPTPCLSPHLYISQQGAGLPVMKCTINADGTLGDCATSGDPLTDASLGNAINNGFAYFATGNEVRYATIDPALGGALGASTATGGVFNAPTGIAFNKTKAYVLNGALISECSVHATGGLTGCTTFGSNLSNPQGITIYKDFAYITNLTDDTYTRCSLTTKTCDAAVFSPLFFFPKGITISNGFMYVVGQGVSKCPVDNAGAASTITYCSVNAATGAFSGCQVLITVDAIMNATIGISIY